MRSLLSHNIFIFTCLGFVATLQVTIKPSFHPYCSTKKLCKRVCSCEAAPNCNILPIDEEFKQRVLLFQNQIRDAQSNKIPSPAGLAVLQYDEELEEVSTCWAVRCRNEFSECFITTKYRETTQTVTQLVLQNGQKPNILMWQQAMEDWVDLVGKNPSKIIEKLPTDPGSEYLNNYAQLMSDRILFVGCSWSFNVSSNGLMLVCTYGPRGSLKGQPIYMTGTPCSACPFGYACNKLEPFRNLCKLDGHSGAISQKSSGREDLEPLYSFPVAVGRASIVEHDETTRRPQEISEERESIEDMYEELALPEVAPSTENLISPRLRVDEPDPWDEEMSSANGVSYISILITLFMRFIINLFF